MRPENSSDIFDQKITVLMEKLGFKGGQLVTSFEPLPKPTPEGMEICRFLVRTNPGEPFLPLARSASGGEISRLMLAIKSVLAEQDHIPVLIFDEIDTGVGGVWLRGRTAICNLSRTIRYSAFHIFTR